MIAWSAHLVALAVLPILVLGVIQRTRSLWTGRRGAGLLQVGWDLLRLLRKTPVRSAVASPLLRTAPWISLGAALASTAVVPLLGGAAPASFAGDFVWLAYAWGLGRAAVVLAALDTGSPFEGMGASREATWAVPGELVWIGVLGALCATTGRLDLAGATALHPSAGPGGVVWLASLAALFVVAQLEGSRVPIDDPATHLELTMIHEVMVLDHAGPELAAMQLASAVKLTVALSLLARLLDPWSGEGGPLGAAAHLGALLGLAVLVGTVESLVARLRLAAVPRYLAGAVVAAGLALLATTWGAA